MPVIRDLVSVEQAVSVGGYRIGLFSHANKKGLVEGIYPAADDWVNGEIQCKGYDPVKVTGLFRRFAEIGQNLEASVILDFANAYGLLKPNALAPSFPVGSDGRVVPNSSVCFVEPLDLWRTQIRAVAGAVCLLNAIDSHDKKKLRELVKWEGPAEDKANRLLRLTIDLGMPADSLGREEWERWQHFQPTRPWDVGRAYLQSAINFHLAQTTSARVLLNPKTGKQELWMQPSGLLGVIWYQLALALCTPGEARQCATCSGWFQVSKTAKRISCLYCSGKCRSQSRRNKIKRSRELHGKGMKPSDIAKVVGSDAGTVRGWVQDHRL